MPTAPKPRPRWGGKKTGPNPTDRSKLGVKRSLLVDGRGVVLGVAVDGANRHDSKLLQKTLRSVPVSYPPLRRRRARIHLCLDKGYDYPEIRHWLQEVGFVPHIRGRGEEAKPCPNLSGYRPRRWVVERSHSWLNRYRRILIRWEKKAENYTALLHFVFGIIAFQQTGLFG